MVDLEFLQHTTLFHAVEARHTPLLQKVGREFGFKAGEYLFRQADQAETIFVIQSGQIELAIPLKILGVEKDVVIEELSNGATLAWSAMVPPHTLTMSARAVTASRLLGFDRSDLVAAFTAEPALGYIVMTNLASVIGRRLHLTKALWLRELQRSVSEKYR